MRQVAQRPRSGDILVRETPEPEVREGFVLVRNHYSLISIGTERAKVEFGGKNLIQKARSRPDLVRKVVGKARADGLRTAVSVVRDRLEMLSPVGYSSAGVILAVGPRVRGLRPGDRVACGGAGYANHAEIVAVPCNLVARVPPSVDLASASYATVGAIAMHAVRQAEASLGERIGVIGLGLVGQLAVRLLHAAGCQAIGIDLDEAACELAAEAGTDAFSRNDPALEAKVLAATDDLGLDAVLICAATSSSDPMSLAARLARDRGKIVIVGDVPVVAPRALLYEKELEVRLARSYGPGRYDRDYEEHGRDLPPGYVRWTEGRNLQAFLDLIAFGRVDPGPLTTHRFPVAEARTAYDLIVGATNGRRPFGVILEYGERPQPQVPHQVGRRRIAGPRIGLIGSGAFARSTFLPILCRLRADLAAVASGGGLAASDVAERFGFERACTAEEIIDDDSISGVIIATRHASHAPLAAAALRAGKAVLVEKPLALSEEELLAVETALTEGGSLMVGFNRRFAPLVERLRRELEGMPDRVVIVRVNAGPLPADHWLNDAEEGGGRLIGEGCHFVDLLTHLAAAPPVSVHAVAPAPADRPLECAESVLATFRFADGSVGTLAYTGAGDPRLPKERIESFAGGLAAVLDDFRRLELYRDGRKTVVKSRRDKGHRAELERFLAVAAGDEEPPPVAGYLASSRATLALARSLRSGVPVELGR